MNKGTVVVGLGNIYRRDDGVGVAAAAALDELTPSGVDVVTDIAESVGLLEAWSGATLAVLIDAAITPGISPGRVRRWGVDDLVVAAERTSSHTLDLARTYALGQALGQVPDTLVLFTVQAADTGYGIGLTPTVAAAVPNVVDAVMAEIHSARTSVQGRPHFGH